MEMIQESPYRFVIPRHGRMRVPGVVFATRALIPDLAADRCLEQVINVAELPGIVTASYAMPDMHRGYGYPIGGVAATLVALMPDPAPPVPTCFHRRRPGFPAHLRRG